MSATRLLVLAFVRARRRAHGYLVSQDLLAWRADRWAHTKTGSIYHALRQLSKEGLLRECGVASNGKSPARTEYEISETGDDAFHALLEKALTIPESRADMFCAGLVLMSALPRSTVLGFLRRRLAELTRQRTTVDGVDTDNWMGEQPLPPHVPALLDFWMQHTRHSHGWTQTLIDTIEGGAYVFADDNPRAFATPGSARSPD